MEARTEIAAPHRNEALAVGGLGNTSVVLSYLQALSR